MKADNEGIDYTIPSCLKPGYYLVRHEIIALHAAYQYPGAQFYPGCHQLKVVGAGSTVPTDLVGFPGAYAQNDSGIVYDAYKGEFYLSVSYCMPAKCRPSFHLQDPWPCSVHLLNADNASPWGLRRCR